MKPIRDLTGLRFGRLVAKKVVRNFEASSKYKHGMFWLCECDCGNQTVVCGSSLTRKKTPTRSCKCLRNEGNNKLPKGEAQFNFLLRSYIKGAKERGLNFKLSRKLFRKLITSNCFYCGVEPRYVSYRTDLNGGFSYNGIDRTDNSVGYVKSNVVSCCINCNRAKRNLSLEEFLVWIKRLVSYQTKINK